MAITRRKLSDLKPYKNNPRTHPPRQVEQLAGLIKEFGFHDSHAIAVDEDDVIIWGHGRLEAARMAGEDEVPVEVLTGLSNAQKQTLRISDNGIAEQSDWDMEVLARELSQLDSLDDLSLGLADELLDSLENLEQPDEGGWSGALGGLSSDDRAPFQQMTFTLHDDQVEEVRRAIAVAKGMGEFDSENENSNGNAIARICEIFLTDNGNS